MRNRATTESILTGMLYCLAGSVLAGLFSSAVLMLLVQVLRLLQ